MVWLLLSALLFVASNAQCSSGSSQDACSTDADCATTSGTATCQLDTSLNTQICRCVSTWTTTTTTTTSSATACSSSQCDSSADVTGCSSTQECVVSSSDPTSVCGTCTDICTSDCSPNTQCTVTGEECTAVTYSSLSGTATTCYQCVATTTTTTTTSTTADPCPSGCQADGDCTVQSTGSNTWTRGTCEFPAGTTSSCGSCSYTTTSTTSTPSSCTDECSSTTPCSNAGEECTVVTYTQSGTSMSCYQCVATTTTTTTSTTTANPCECSTDDDCTDTTWSPYRTGTCNTASGTISNCGTCDYTTTSTTTTTTTTSTDPCTDECTSDDECTDATVSPSRTGTCSFTTTSGSTANIYCRACVYDATTTSTTTTTANPCECSTDDDCTTAVRAGTCETTTFGTISSCGTCVYTTTSTTSTTSDSCANGCRSNDQCTSTDPSTNTDISGTCIFSTSSGVYSNCGYCDYGTSTTTTSTTTTTTTATTSDSCPNGCKTDGDCTVGDSTTNVWRRGTCSFATTAGVTSSCGSCVYTTTTAATTTSTSTTLETTTSTSSTTASASCTYDSDCDDGYSCRLSSSYCRPSDVTVGSSLSTNDGSITCTGVCVADADFCAASDVNAFLSWSWDADLDICDICLCEAAGTRDCSGIAQAFQNADDNSYIHLMYVRYCDRDEFVDLKNEDGTLCDRADVLVKDLVDIDDCNCGALYCDGGVYQPAGSGANMRGPMVAVMALLSVLVFSCM